MAERRTRRSETIYHSVYNMNAGLYKYFLDQKFCINLSVYAILNKRRNLTTITNNNLSRIEENNKTPYQGACLNLIYKFDFGKKVKVKRAKSIQTTSVSVSAILSCRPFFILIFLPCIKMNHYGFSRKSIWKNLETFP